MKSFGFNGVDQLSVTKLAILLEWRFVALSTQGKQGEGAEYSEE